MSEVLTKKVENSQTVQELKFTKQQLLKSQKFANRRDALQALLKDDETYTDEQVKQILDKFYKGGKK